jgi:putative membrane protein
MAGFVLRFLVCAFALAIAGAVVPGIHFDEPRGVFVAAFLLGLVNAFLRPALVILTLPFTILTLGLFLLVLNAALLGLVAAMVESFRIDGFLAAFLGALLVSVVSGLASWTIGPSGRVEVVRRRGAD